MRHARAVLGVVGLCALLGALLAALQLAHGAPLEGVVREAPSTGAWEVATGFGPVAIERVQRVGASGHGAFHGGLGVVREDEVRVRVRLENRLGHAVPYSPGQLRLGRAGAAATTSPVDPIAGRGVIPPGESVRQEIAFLVPEDSTRLALLVDDLIGARPLRIGVGTVPSP